MTCSKALSSVLSLSKNVYGICQLNFFDFKTIVINSKPLLRSESLYELLKESFQSVIKNSKMVMPFVWFVHITGKPNILEWNKLETIDTRKQLCSLFM